MVDEGFKVWQRVLAQGSRITATSLQVFFDQDLTRGERFSRFLGDDKGDPDTRIFVDFSKQLIDQQALDELLVLAKDLQIIEQFAEMRAGLKINLTEQQSALHTALRADIKTSVIVDGVDVVAEVHAERKALRRFVDAVRSDRKFKKIVNIGIGGSDLGPALVYEALFENYKSEVECAFVANIDAHEIKSVLSKCVAAETLFVVCSKSFSTVETLSNARIAKQWLAEKLGVDIDDQVMAEHFVVVSAHPDRAAKSGVVAANSFKIWPWVGGRYSISSAMCLAPMLAFGADVFDEFLVGMRAVDDQMQNSVPTTNLPLILGLIDVWNCSVLGYTSQAIVPYAHQLKLLPSYLQQLMMESNGKSVQVDGEPTSMRTSPVVWGGVGTNAQHAFFQMLHQGTDVVPVEFIGFAQATHNEKSAHDTLIANMFAQSKALAFGRSLTEINSENSEDENSRHRVMPGNRPSTTVLASNLSARTLGSLVAMYEHRVFVQGVVFGINSFDQWGVELGKTLATEISGSLTKPAENSQNLRDSQDSSTHGLINWYRLHRGNR
ncbi:MAG: glucose-6-phosphate isomerase [Actinomycetota bacterium]